MQTYLFVLTLLACVLLSCTSSSIQKVTIPDVTTEFETIVDPNADASFAIEDVVKVKIILTGTIDASFTILIGAGSTDPKNRPVTVDYVFSQLSGYDEIETEWYGDPMRFVYQPSADVSGGNLEIEVTFLAVH